MRDGLVFHNKCGSQIVLPDGSPHFLRLDRNSHQPVPEDFPEPSPIPRIVEPVIAKEAPQPPPSEDVRRSKNLVVMLCLPVEEQKHKDDLYGEEYVKRTWGKKTTFDAVVVKREDLFMRFRSEFPPAVGSIVYPSKYRDNSPYGDHRWWKVRQVDSLDVGYEVVCIPSDVQPDFTD